MIPPFSSFSIENSIGYMMLYAGILVGPMGIPAKPSEEAQAKRRPCSCGANLAIQSDMISLG